MDPVGQWSAYAASYSRLPYVAGGDSHLSTVSGTNSTLPFGTAAVPTASPQQLLQTASTPTPYASTALIPSTPVGGYNSGFTPSYNHKTYQPSQVFKTDNDCYNSSGLAVNTPNVFYDNHNNEVLANQSPAESISPQIRTQLQNAYGIIRQENVIHNSTVIKSGVPSVPCENFNTQLLSSPVLNSQTSDAVYGDKTSNGFQQCGAALDITKNSFYPNISRSPVFGTPNPAQQIRKKSVPVPCGALSPSPLSSLPLNATLPSAMAGPNSPDSLPYYVRQQQHQSTIMPASNFINSEQPQSITAVATKSHQFSDMHSKMTNLLPQPNCSLPTNQSTDLSSKAHSFPNIPHSKLPNNMLFPQSISPSLTSHKSYQQSMLDKHQHNVYSEVGKNYVHRIPNSISNSSSQSSPVNFSLVGLSNSNSNLCSSKMPDSAALDRSSHFHTAFNRQSSTSLSPAYKISSYNDPEYARSLQPPLIKGGSEKMMVYSPCSRSEPSTDMGKIISPLESNLQTSPSSQVRSPVYPSNNSPISSTLSSASQPTCVLPTSVDSTLSTVSKYYQDSPLQEASMSEVLDNSLNRKPQLLLPQPDETLKISTESNLSVSTQLNQQSFWQDNNHNFKKSDCNYDVKRQSLSSGQYSQRNSFQESETNDSNLFYNSPLSEKKLPTSDNNPISLIKNGIQDTAYLHTNVITSFDLQHSFQQRKSKESPLMQMSQKESVEINDESNLSLSSSPSGKMPTSDETNVVRLNKNVLNPINCAQVHSLDNSPSELKNSGRNSSQSGHNQNRSVGLQQPATNDESNSFCKSPSKEEILSSDEGNPVSLIRNIPQSPVTNLLTAVHLPEILPSKRLKMSSESEACSVELNIMNNQTETFTTTNTSSDTVLQQKVNDSITNNSLSISLSDIDTSSTQNQLIKFDPVDKFDQSLMVSDSQSNQILSNNRFDSQTPPDEFSIPTNSSSSCNSTVEKENVKPRVIVPSIEEELNFLSDPVVKLPLLKQEQKPKARRGRPPKKKEEQAVKMPEKKPLSFPADINNGFMASYIKFLQGERDTSLPKTSKTPNSKLKSSLSNTPQPSRAKQTQNKVDELNVIKDKKAMVCDIKDNSLHVPLNKASIRPDNLSGSNDEENFMEIKSDAEQENDQLPTSHVLKKHFLEASEHSGEMSQNLAGKREMNDSDKEIDIQYDSPENVVPPPRREQSTRKAKEKSSIKRILQDEYEENDEFNSINSDSDPAWSPAAMKDDSDEDFDNRRRTRRTSLRGSGQRGRKRGRPSNLSELSMSSDDELDDRKVSKQKKYSTRTTHGKTGSQGDDKSNDSDTIIVSDSVETKTTVKDEFPFHVGDFVMNKNDVGQENPPIWRVDGKSLLQKFEASEQRGELVYKNIPTYAGWTLHNKDSFQKVPVKIKMQSRNEIVVELLNTEMKLTEEEQKAIDSFMEETMKYQDNFEIYIQTLISQALDSNFLAEIIQENDEYFLENVKAIDDITSERRQKLIEAVDWQDSIVEKSMATWPCFDVLQSARKDNVGSKICRSCKIGPVAKQVIAYGQPYNNDNLEGCAADPAVSNHKDFLLCKKCIQVVTLFNKIVHQKYLMFIQCANKVQDKRTRDPAKDTTVILNELLADEQWLSQLFKDVRTNWAQVERFIVKKQDDGKTEAVEEN